jgi:hypothetical protein
MANYYTFNLKANQPIQVPVQGKVILVDSIGAAPGLDITPALGGQTGKTMPGRLNAFKVWVDYDQITLAAPVDCTVALFLSMLDVSLGFTNGSSINVAGSVAITNGPGARVPVDIGGGTVDVTASNVTVGNDGAHPVPVTQAGLTTLVDEAPVVINTGAAQALVADATLKRLRVRNASAAASVALGGAGVTLANAAILLAPGETWVEQDAAGAAWYATSDTNGADVRVQGVK